MIAAMEALEALGRTKTRDGQDLVLFHRHGTFYYHIDGLELMSSLAHGSEDALARLAQEAVAGVADPRVLIGGLGMGFTLRAALDCFPPKAEIVVAEVFPQVVRWNRGPLAHLARRPLNDRRVRVIESDVVEVIGTEPFDAILLDVDNGPEAFTLASNGRLYSVEGIRRTCQSLSPGGVVTYWSVVVEPVFERRLKRAGCRWHREMIRARGAAGGPRHTIYVAQPFDPHRPATKAARSGHPRRGKRRSK